MSNRRGFTIIEGIIVALALCVIAGVFADAVRESSLKRQCHDAGYADVRIIGALAPWFASTYCIRRVNQTDVVVPLDSVQERRP